jgi:hypothetical protein
MKQIKNKYLGLLLIAGLVFSLQSCLKNGKYYVDFSKGATAVELPLAAHYVNKPFALALDVSATPTTYYAVVNVASVDVPSAPVTATLSVDKAYLDQYNADHGTSYELLPDSAYSIPNMEATIAAGHREDSVPILINTTKVESGHSWILPISISKSSVNISNWSHLMINVTAKNEWDGKYDIHVEISGANAYTGTVFDDSGYPLSTVNANSVAPPYIGDWFGGYEQFTFNADGTVTVLVGSGPSDPNSYGAVVNSSSYDKSNHSFHVNYSFLGGKYVFDETYVKE